MSVDLEQRKLPEPLLIVSVLALLGLGAIMVSSASVGIADEDGVGPLYYFVQHLSAITIGLVGVAVVSQIPIAWWDRLASLNLVGAFALLILVVLPGVGTTTNGATRWLDIGPVGLQPSELARLMLLIWLASYCVRQHDALRLSFGGFARPMILIGLAGALLLREPDLGATVVLAASSLGILFLAGARLRDLTGAAIAASVAFAILIWTSSYRFDRITSWWNPWEDALNSGYQLVNSFIAIGSGTFFGLGLGAGVQKLHYLPEPHTDFIFAVLAEELGLLGATLVIVLFSILVYRAFEISRRAFAAGLPFHGLLSAGIGITLGLQAAISIGVNTGMLPTKGLTLPLISYGRTSVVVTLAALGMLLRVAYEIGDPARRRGSGARP
jgi:cell division protein FtsW